MFAFIRNPKNQNQKAYYLTPSNWSITTICLIEYCQQWHIRWKLRLDTCVCCDTSRYLFNSKNGRLAFIPANDTFPIEIDFCWFTFTHTVPSRNVAHDFVQWQFFFRRLEFHIEMRSKLSINFVGLSAYTTKQQIIIIRKSNQIYSKWQQITTCRIEFCRSSTWWTMNSRTLCNAYLREWCWSAIGEMGACRESAFPMSLINTV